VQHRVAGRKLPPGFDHRQVNEPAPIGACRALPKHCGFDGPEIFPILLPLRRKFLR